MLSTRMMSDILLLAVLYCAVAVLYKYRARIFSGLKRFDARNAARKEEEFWARFDADAHYVHTLRLVEEQFEPVNEFKAVDPRTGVPLPRYVFLGDEYDSREEAEAARRAAVIAQARAFYIEMDTIMLRRGPQHERAPDARGLPAPRQKGE